MCILCLGFGGHTWLSLVGPELEARARNKKKKAGSHCPIKAIGDNFGVGQGSLVICFLAIVHLYIQSSREREKEEAAKWEKENSLWGQKPGFLFQLWGLQPRGLATTGSHSFQALSFFMTKCVCGHISVS